MAGETFTSTVNEGLDTVILSARSTREYPADVMLKVCDRDTLPEHKGTAWREFLAAALTAQHAGETDTYDNPQAFDGSVLSATPQLAIIETFIGKRVQWRLNTMAFATFGDLGQQAIQRLKDQDGLAVFASLSATAVSGTGATLTSGNVMAAVRRITSNSNEPGAPPIVFVAHGYQIHDLQSEILGGIGTYTIPQGYTEETYKRGFVGEIQGARVHEDGLIALTSTPDARGAIFAKRGILCVQGHSPWTERKDRPEKGYGGESVYLKDEYIWVERSPGNWAIPCLSDATAPT